jgi:hypothetical protein
MIKFKAVILQVGFNYQGITVTEDAVIDLIAKYKPVQLVLKSNISDIQIGIIESLEYDKETKNVIGVVVLNADIGLNMTPKQTLETPKGQVVLETEIKTAALLFRKNK